MKLKIGGAVSAGVLVFVAGCGEQPALSAYDSATAQSALEVSQPEGWDDDLPLVIPPDLNPDPNILEIELEAKLADIEFIPGSPTRTWTYNGAVPGPLIRAKMGDRVIVHFKNSLPEATTIHWHGLRVPNNMDGAPGMTQDPVESGDGFRYEFMVKDAGTYWYHPHVNSAAQVGWGLYGPIVVEDPDDPVEFGDDLVLVVSDMSLDDNGVFQAVDSGGKFGDLFGREGSVLLVNGKVMPRLKVRTGKQQRWRIINAARSRYYKIRLPDHRMWRLGGDNGLAASAEDIYSVVVTPGERTDLVFTPSDPPGTLRTMHWVPTDRGYGTQFARPRVSMMEIETVDLPPVRPADIPTRLRTIEPIDLSNAIHMDVELTISLSKTDVIMGINGIPWWDVEPIQARIGETHVWRLINNTDFDHPFHLHGYFFQVLDDTRVPEWKDTVNVPVKSEISIAIQFDERPGMWMYHCHILDHAEVGMMGHLHVSE